MYASPDDKRGLLEEEEDEADVIEEAVNDPEPGFLRALNGL